MGCSGPGPGPRSFFRLDWLRKKCGCFGNRHNEIELFGLVLFIIGITTLCAFFLPSNIWLIVLGGVMIFCGFRLFIG